MPAASAKPEKQASVEGPDASKQFLVTIDKKIRNLEKRKVKLDLIREKIERGEELNSDQQEAVSKYDGVILNLEFVRDLHKQYAQFLTDMEKEQKKAKKRERMENRAQEQKRLQEILSVQRILDAMGSDTAREDFTNGTNGAIKLTEEQLNSLDELYKLVCPSNEEETEVEFSKQLVSASNHFLNLLEGKDKKVINTTYKSLRELLTTIEECGYLDSDVTETPAVESVANEEAGAEEEEAVKEEQDPVNQNGVHDEENSGLNPIGDMGLISDHTEVSAIIPDPMLSSQLQDRVGDATGADIVDDSFFAATPAFPTKLSAAQRPPNEIVSSVQGNFNFLQDSEIDPESPHMDPAVLAVHPMSTHHKQQQPDLTQSTLSQTQQQTYQSMLDKPISQQQQSSQAGDYSSQAYGQTLMSQSLQDSSLSQETPDVPQPIPMPNHSPDSQKKFTMNPGAPVFHSIYSKSSEFSNSENQEDADDKNEDGDDFQESSGFSSRNSGYNKNRGRGGNRGNVSNGYQQRGGRGGQYGNSRGGYNSSGRGSGRGSYQGYPRNDYRSSEGGYNNQGYNGGSSSGGYQGNKNNRGRGAFNRGGGGAAEGGERGRGGGGSGGRGGTTGGRGNYAKTVGYNQQ